jgi:hypothetical protein
MTDIELDTLIKEQDLVGDDFFEMSFKFWFKDNEQIRTPFPEKIQPELRELTSRIFVEWIIELSDDEKSKLDKEEIVEVFEMFLFNQAIGLVEDEEQKITICYPFLPRAGDVVDDKSRGSSTVIKRQMDVKENNKKYLKLNLKSESASEEWETEFELPA